MKRRNFVGALGGLAICPLCARPSQAADWDWSGPKGPEHWGSLPGYATCGTGSQQSPIDLTGAIKSDLPPLRIAWRKADATITNPGYTIRVNMPPGSLLHAGRAAYQMVEFHFHAPSEHAVDGKRAAMEVHFVHQRATSDDGFGVDPVHGDNDWQAEPAVAHSAFGVVGVRMEAGGANAAFAAIARAMPRQSGMQAPITVTPHAMLPESRRYWFYEGSLTTPGCSEVVSWMVMREPLKVAQSDIETFTALYPNSARPLQPRNRRLLLTSR